MTTGRRRQPLVSNRNRPGCRLNRKLRKRLISKLNRKLKQKPRAKRN